MKNIGINEISVYKENNRTKIKYVKRCEICSFVKLDLISNNLFCIKRNFDFVENFQCCPTFKLDKKFKNEMIDKCIEVFK